MVHIILMGAGLVYLLSRTSGTKPAPKAAPKPAGFGTVPKLSSDTRAWTAERTNTVKVAAGRQYCALVDLTGATAMVATADDVVAELQKLCAWKTLFVWPAKNLAQVPIDLPLSREPVSGRYYVLGTPIGMLTVKRPSEISELFSRPAN